VLECKYMYQKSIDPEFMVNRGRTGGGQLTPLPPVKTRKLAFMVSTAKFNNDMEV
jgi:hypothetical protein